MTVHRRHVSIRCLNRSCSRSVRCLIEYPTNSSFVVSACKRQAYDTNNFHSNELRDDGFTKHGSGTRESRNILRRSKIKGRETKAEVDRILHGLLTDDHQVATPTSRVA